MSKKHKLDASHPGVGKSKIMKKLAKKLKRKYVDVPVQKEWMRHLDAFAALAGSMPKPSDARFSGMNTKQVYDILVLDDVKPNPVEPADRWLVEDLDTNATCWDDQMDEMCRDFHTLRDRLAYVKDNDRLKLVDELLHRIVDVRCQLDTMKKEQN